MQKARRHTLSLRTIVLRPLVGTWFQVLFPPLAGVLSIFQSPYWFTIGHREYLALRDGPRASHGVPRAPSYSGTPREAALLSHTGLSPSMAGLSNRSANRPLCNSHVRGPQPREENLRGLGCSAFARRY